MLSLNIKILSFIYIADIAVFLLYASKFMLSIDNDLVNQIFYIISVDFRLNVQSVCEMKR